MADGLTFEINPRNCQFGGALESGQLKYTEKKSKKLTVTQIIESNGCIKYS